MKTVEELNELNDVYREKAKKNDELVRFQVQHLVKIKEERDHLIKWYLDNGYTFSHPRFKYISQAGPILHLDKDYLYYWNINSGLKKKDIYRDEIESTNLLEILKADGFQNAVIGIKYVDDMMMEYVRLLEQHNEKLQTEIDSLDK